MNDASLILVTRPVQLAANHPAEQDGFVVADPHSSQLRVLDLGATRGDGIFETVSVTGGHAHALEPHLARFAYSAKLLDLPQPDLDVWRNAVAAAIANHPPVPEMFVKLVLTRGIEGGDIPTAWVYGEQSGDFSAARTEGIRVVTLDRGYRHDVAKTSPWLLQGAKTLSYAVNRSAIREAKRRGADDVVFVSSDGFLLEGPSSTLVLRNGNRIRTPKTDQGILAGTTQASAFEFFEAEGFETSFEMIPLEELAAADAAWLLSSVRQAAPVRSADGLDLAVDTDLTGRLNDHLLSSPN
jgi:4-amino-4-deoxychorismate lyase